VFRYVVVRDERDEGMEVISLSTNIKQVVQY
jgi:hypothetical protein